MNKIYKAIVILFFLLILLTTSVYGVEVPNKGLITDVEGVPTYSNSDFNNAKVNIEVLVSEWCPICGELKRELPKILYKQFSEKEVAMRIWDNSEKTVVDYFDYLMDQAKAPIEIRGFVPIIIVNQQYYYAGYDSKTRDILMADIEAIVADGAVPFGGNLVANDGSITSKRGIFSTIKENVFSKIQMGLNLTDYFTMGIIDGLRYLNLYIFLIGYMLFYNKHTKRIPLFLSIVSAVVVGNLLMWRLQIPFLGHDYFVNANNIFLYLSTIFIVYMAFWKLYVRVFYWDSKKKIKSTKSEKLLGNMQKTKLNYFLTGLMMILFVLSKSKDGMIILNAPSFAELLINQITTISIFIYSLGLVLILAVILLIGERIRQYMETNSEGKPIKIEKIGVLFYLCLLLVSCINLIIFLN